MRTFEPASLALKTYVLFVARDMELQLPDANLCHCRESCGVGDPDHCPEVETAVTVEPTANPLGLDEIVGIVRFIGPFPSTTKLPVNVY